MTQAWRDDANCIGVDVSLFFPITQGDKTPDAQKLCRRCPVRAECLADALRVRDIHGYRGGMSGDARQALLVEQAREHTLKAVDELEQASILRLRGKRWTPASIAARLGVDERLVYRFLKAHREAAA